MRATLHSSRWLSGDVREVVLTTSETLDYRPGQYVGIARPGEPIRRYSFAQAPSGDNRIALHIRRWPGGKFSERVMGESAIGDVFEVSAPLGAFALPSGTGPIFMLATGTGVAPFLAMLEAFLPGSRRPISLYWGARALGDLYVRELLAHWQAQFPCFRFIPVISGQGEGHVQEVAARELRDPATTHVLACGNVQMIEDAYAHFVAGASNPVAGFASDAFAPATDESEFEPGASADPKSVAENAVTLFVDGLRLTAHPGESVLSALRSAGLPVMSVCGGKASCGTCLVELESEWVERVTPCSRTERNLLACLPDSGPLSRLGCQIRITRDLEGLRVRLPSINPTERELSV